CSTKASHTETREPRSEIPHLGRARRGSNRDLRFTSRDSARSGIIGAWVRGATPSLSRCCCFGRLRLPCAVCSLEYLSHLKSKPAAKQWAAIVAIWAITPAARRLRLIRNLLSLLHRLMRLTL